MSNSSNSGRLGIVICLAAMLTLTLASTVVKSVATAQAEKPPYTMLLFLDAPDLISDQSTPGYASSRAADMSGWLTNYDDAWHYTESHVALQCDRRLISDSQGMIKARLDAPYVLKVKTRKFGSADFTEATCKF